MNKNRRKNIFIMECKKYVNKTNKQIKKKRKAIKCYKCKKINANLHIDLFYKNKPTSKKIVRFIIIRETQRVHRAFL